jgi:hypothetical protein
VYASNLSKGTDYHAGLAVFCSGYFYCNYPKGKITGSTIVKLSTNIN